MKYAVAIAYPEDGEMKLEVVEAETSRAALAKHSWVQDNRLWEYLDQSEFDDAEAELQEEEGETAELEGGVMPSSISEAIDEAWSEWEMLVAVEEVPDA